MTATKTPKATPSKSPLARWTPKLLELPALSVRQPWAWLIVNGFKDIENRSRRTHHRGPLLIHAGLSPSDYNPATAEWIRQKCGINIPTELDFGAVVGLVDVVDCVSSHPSRWFQKGGFGYVLANARRLPPLACRGQLGVFKPDWE